MRVSEVDWRYPWVKVVFNGLTHAMALVEKQFDESKNSKDQTIPPFDGIDLLEHAEGII